jgi:hypothetical protein
MMINRSRDSTAAGVYLTHQIFCAAKAEKVKEKFNESVTHKPINANADP